MLNALRNAGQAVSSVMKSISSITLFCLLFPGFTSALAAEPDYPAPLFVEAETYDAQTLTEVRRWYHIRQDTELDFADPDPSHAATASGGEYLEILPDTRVTHDDPLVYGTSLAVHGGEMAVLSYSIELPRAGLYYVWVRAYSTGSEDNGIHVGMNGYWPSTGARIQWCANKNAWTWSSAQRVEFDHCGLPTMISVYASEPGAHRIEFSMREDGFEFDKFALTQDPHWFPEGFFDGRLVEDFGLLHALHDFELGPVPGYLPYYRDEARNALAINASLETHRYRYAAARYTFDGPENHYRLSLITMSEIDGESDYLLRVNGKLVGAFTNPETETDYSLHRYSLDHVALKPGDLIQVESQAVTNGKIPEGEATAFARGRWRALSISSME